MVIQGFTHPLRVHFLEEILERTCYKMTTSNQLGDYGQDKLWKTQRRQLILHQCTLSCFVSEGRSSLVLCSYIMYILTFDSIFSKNEQQVSICEKKTILL